MFLSASSTVREMWFEYSLAGPEGPAYTNNASESICRRVLQGAPERTPNSNGIRRFNDPLAGPEGPAYKNNASPSIRKRVLKDLPTEGCQEEEEM